MGMFKVWIWNTERKIICGTQNKVYRPQELGQGNGMYEWKSAEHSGSLGYERKKLKAIEGFWEGAQK